MSVGNQELINKSSEEFSEERRNARQRVLCRFLLIGFILAMCVLDIMWIRLNTAPPRMFDDSLYLIESVDLYHTLQNNGLVAFLKGSMTHSRGGHPPMMKILPVPFYVVFSPSVNSALYAYTLLIAVFCVYLFLLTKTLVDSEKAALLAVVVTCLFPLTYGMWRNILAEFGIAVATVACLYHLLKSSEFRNKTHVFLAGLFLGWGLLWKISFPVFVIGPFTYVLIRRLRDQNRGETGSLMRNAALLLLAVCVVAGPFYITSYRPVLNFLLFSMENNAYNQNWSLGPVFSIRTLLRYWLSNINFGISSYFFALIVALLAFRVAAGKKWFSPFVRWFLITWFLPPFLVLSFQVLKEIRHLLPAYPVVGIFVAICMTNAFGGLKRSAQVCALILLGLFPFYLFVVSSFDLAFLPRRDLKLKRFVISTRDLESASLQMIPTYTFPANRTHWPIEETLDIISKQSASSAGHLPRVRVDGTNPYFNGVTLDLSARLRRLPLFFEGPFNTSISKSDFVVTLSGPNGMEPYLQRLIVDQRLPFAHIADIAFSSQHADVSIYKKVTGQPTAPPNKLWENLVDETEAYGHLEFTGSRERSVTGYPGEMLVADPGTDIKFNYVYVPDSGASLQFLVGVGEKAPTGCVLSWRLTVTEMDAESPTNMVRSGTIDTAIHPQSMRWRREAVSLNEFAGKIVEIALASPSNTSKSASCDGLGWNDIRMRYGSLEERAQWASTDDYRLEVSPSEVIAGKGLYVFRIVGLSNVTVDVQYRLDESPAIEMFSTQLDAQGKVKFDVSSASRKGFYRFIGFRISGTNKWFRTDTSIIVR